MKYIAHIDNKKTGTIIRESIIIADRLVICEVCGKCFYTFRTNDIIVAAFPEENILYVDCEGYKNNEAEEVNNDGETSGGQKLAK